uniref:mS116 n=1 Tax=Polytomella magna TaxID=353565 RepID=UPI002240E381|nr:Chain Yk, mS116 [Polytomella magna]8APN_Yk Chain Yk, mS116 [Polytomella magna]8APO_Yk Chain Yk, mS116 [Polytomella magna]
GPLPEDVFLVAPKVAAAVQQTQAQLIDLLAPYGYSFDAFSEAVLEDLSKTKELCVKARFVLWEARVLEALEAVRPFVSGPVFRTESEAAALT